jgi:hypothetical protein
MSDQHLAGAASYTTQEEHPYIAGFEPTIPTMKRPKTDALNRRVTGIDPVFV